MSSAIAVAHIFYNLKEPDLLAWIDLFIKRSDKTQFHHTIVNVAGRVDPQIKSTLKDYDVIFMTTDKLSTLGTAFALRNILSNHKIKIIQSHHPLISAATVLASRLMGIKAIHTCHDSLIDQYQRNMWNKFNGCCIVSSEYIKEKLLEKKWMDKNKIKLIYNGIDVYLYDQSQEEKLKYKKQLGLDLQAYIIGNMGSLVKEEDQATLIKAFRKLAQKKMPAQLVFTGDGPLLEDLQQLVIDFELQDKVKFLGHKLNKPQYFQVFDVLVDSSFSVKYPYLLLEAMSASVPVVATKIGANPEIVIERDTGWIVPCGFPERIESAIMKLNAIKTLSAEMGQKAKEHVHSNFNINKMSSQYEQIYSEGVV